MPILLQQRIRFTWSPASSRIEVTGFLAGQQRGIEAPSRFGEIRADEEGLIVDHDVAEQRLVGFGETEREPFTGLEHDQQHVGWNTAGIERPKHLGRGLTKGHCNLGQFTREAFTCPEIERHALPSPVVDLRFERDIRLRGRILRDSLFLAITWNRLAGDLPGRDVPSRRSMTVWGDAR